jgi:hypothetical protein
VRPCAYACVDVLLCVYNFKFVSVVCIYIEGVAACMRVCVWWYAPVLLFHFHRAILTATLAL